MAKTQAFINRERQSVNRVAVKVSRSKAEFVMSNPGYSGCAKYEVSSGGTNCNCSQFASRLFHHTTNVRNNQYSHGALRKYITRERGLMSIFLIFPNQHRSIPILQDQGPSWY